MQRNQKEGLSARQMILLFLAGTAVCAVFFALGFVAGFNHHSEPVSTENEQVTGSSSVIPPTVNPPLEKDQAPGSAAAAAGSNSSEPQTEHVSEPRSAPQPAPPPARHSKAQDPSGEAGSAPVSASLSGMILQVIASSSRKDAENLVSTLKSRGYPAFLVTPQDTHSSDSLFRVQVGPFSSRRDADEVRKKLSDQGFHPFLRR